MQLSNIIIKQLKGFVINKPNNYIISQGGEPFEGPNKCRFARSIKVNC